MPLRSTVNEWTNERMNELHVWMNERWENGGEYVHCVFVLKMCGHSFVKWPDEQHFTHTDGGFILNASAYKV